MESDSVLISSYLEERELLMRSRWLTLTSWYKRFMKGTRYDELGLLLNKESEFNILWVDKVVSYLSSNCLDKYSSLHIILLIETHVKKHNERGIFVLIFGALVAAVLKSVSSDWVFSSYLIIVAIFVAMERIYASNVSTALEELSGIVKLAEEKRSLPSQQNAEVAQLSA